MDLTIPVGAPAVPLQVTIGATAYTVVLHDNGDNTYLLRLEAADGTYTDLLGAPCAVGKLVCVGRVVESIAAEATGLAYIRP